MVKENPDKTTLSRSKTRIRWGNDHNIFVTCLAVFYIQKYQNYIDVLPEFLRSCNAKFHRSIKRSPDPVSPVSIWSFWLALYGYDLAAKRPIVKKCALATISKMQKILAQVNCESIQKIDPSA